MINWTVWGAVIGVVAAAAHADVDPVSGVDMVRIGAVGNAAWQGDGFASDSNIGRGSVGYEYYIGRLEVTTAQWAEFFNAFYSIRTLNDTAFPGVYPPARWGAHLVSPVNLRWTVPAGREMFPVGGISWRTAAVYCNWLHNGKAVNREAFMNGAYDVSTFGQAVNVYFDQLAHNPDARYWIPTRNEWMKAVHYDPNKDGGVGGWWREGNGSNQISVAGPPGIGQANYGFSTPDPFSIPLGSYPDVRSPWGLLDVAGGTSEWMEDAWTSFGQNQARYYDGSNWSTEYNGYWVLDTIYSTGTTFPNSGQFWTGFRLAASVPTPSVVAVLGLAMIMSAKRRCR